VRSTQCTQHAARSTQHAARSTQRNAKSALKQNKGAPKKKKGTYLPHLVAICQIYVAFFFSFFFNFVEDLGFRLDVGGSLVITGHNGAGKSPIFRCLGGLWNVPKGKTAKPGGKATCGLHQDIFYLPQKPYNVLGTPIDQLTYFSVVRCRVEILYFYSSVV
jgi:ABC-type uncharacterized transport system fused permease/ATPase subunit